MATGVVIGTGATYDCRIHEGGPVIASFEEGEHKAHGGAPEQDDDQLVLELLEDELPYRGGGVFGEGCSGASAIMAPCRRSAARRTVLAVLLAGTLDLLLRQALLLGHTKVLQRLSGRLCEGILHALRAGQLAVGVHEKRVGGLAGRSQGTREAQVVIYCGASTAAARGWIWDQRITNVSFGVEWSRGPELALCSPPTRTRTQPATPCECTNTTCDVRRPLASLYSLFLFLRCHAIAPRRLEVLRNGSAQTQAALDLLPKRPTFSELLPRPTAQVRHSICATAYAPQKTRHRRHPRQMRHRRHATADAPSPPQRGP